MLSCHRASLCPSYSAGKIHCVVLLFSSSWSGLWVLPVALECCPCWGGELGARAAATQLLCGSAAGKWFWYLSTWNLTVLLGRGFLVSPAGCLPFPPPLVPPKLVQFGNHLGGNVVGLGAAWGRKQRGKYGTVQLGRAAALPPSNGNSPYHQGNDVPSAHPAPGLSRTKGLLWSKGTGLRQS